MSWRDLIGFGAAAICIFCIAFLVHLGHLYFQREHRKLNEWKQRLEQRRIAVEGRRRSLPRE